VAIVLHRAPALTLVIMTTLILVRHGRTKANADGVLAGWTPGVFLDDLGQAQAEAVAQRLAPLPLAAIVTSPLERTRQTADVIAADQAKELAQHVDARIGECKYGDWTGRPLKELTKEPMWSVVQAHPSAAVFPGPEGEAMAAMQHRAVAAVRHWNAELGDDAIYVAVSHGDVIKAILADALGVHLDQFQRISVDPCSVSVIRYTSLRPFVLKTNDNGGDLSSLIPKKGTKRRKKSSDAAVGGGAG
jgi:probable phosphomutase (TIGR03848 family)